MHVTLKFSIRPNSCDLEQMAYTPWSALFSHLISSHPGVLTGTTYMKILQGLTQSRCNCNILFSILPFKTLIKIVISKSFKILGCIPFFPPKFSPIWKLRKGVKNSSLTLWTSNTHISRAAWMRFCLGLLRRLKRSRILNNSLLTVRTEVWFNGTVSVLAAVTQRDCLGLAWIHSRSQYYCLIGKFCWDYPECLIKFKVYCIIWFVILMTMGKKSVWSERAWSLIIFYGINSFRSPFM